MEDEYHLENFGIISANYMLRVVVSNFTNGISVLEHLVGQKITSFSGEQVNLSQVPFQISVCLAYP